MRRHHILRAAGGLAALAVLAGGCASGSRSTSTSEATTPQDKAHQEQLAEMGRQDAETADTPTKKPMSPKQARDDRRTGQRVIDQPRR